MYPNRSPLMDMVAFGLVPFALAAVLVILLMGLWNMMRGGDPNRSQSLMRWRVIMQFIAVVIVMGAIWVIRS